ncbi:hypothetical protein [Colwellia hornerae]|uniref:AsmA family protein n=1 Tax=Colwellia hornerae TaxID=89402 RepID=A0A5C6QE31_9GAMM|nr:hypothetical protein [Colwellia hornerae]TWX59425.1 hypothetical protein ESZ28_00315 [Colwellia hornerae]TWX62795.1 hypothetical protein ESZ26_00310 [Colwellia hornerae]TWX67109.1 hypothetical protein ESZ27_09550 [Colwellia hornerae]
MNKFAAIIFVLLLSCGAALWFLASDSLNFHIKNQLQSIGSQLSQQKVTVENVTVHGYQGTGTITKFVISPTPLSNIATTKESTLSIAAINLVIDRDSLKEDIIIIESITIDGLSAFLHYNENGNSFKELLATVQKNIAQFTLKDNSIESPQQIKITPRFLKVTKITVNSAVLNLIGDKDAAIITKKLPSFALKSIDNEAGSPGETIGIKLFEELLIALNNQAALLTKTL